MKSLAMLPVLLLCCAPLYAANGDKMENLPAGASIEKDATYPPVVTYTLKNGLKLLILEKHFVPTVSFTTLFKVGNVDGQQSKTGLAHLFEHMAFKGTKTINSTGYEKEKVALEKVEKAAQALIAAETAGAADAKELEELRKALDAAEKEADKWFREEMEREVINAISRARGSGL